MFKGNLLKIISLFITVVSLVIMLSGCTGNISDPSSMSVKASVFVSGGNETITPVEQVITINKSSTQIVTFTIHSTEPRNYSQIAISINVSGIIDPIICPKNFTNYEINESGAIVNFTETVEIPITLTTSDSLPEEMQTVTVYYSSKNPGV